MRVTYHEHCFAYTRATDHALFAINAVVPTSADIWEHDVRHVRMAGGTGGPVFGFDLARPDPASRVCKSLPNIELQHYESFIRRHEDHMLHDVWDQQLTLQIRCLAWLAKELQGPVSLWFHCGDNGLIFEFFWGFGEESPMLFNEHEVPTEKTALGVPISAFTACMWHVGAKVPNLPERDWIHRPLLHRLIDQRPFFR